MKAISDADIYVGWIGDEQFGAAKQLKWIQSPSSGTNYYLAIPALVESDVLLTSARGTHAVCRGQWDGHDPLIYAWCTCQCDCAAKSRLGCGQIDSLKAR